MENEIGFAFPQIDPVIFALGPVSVKWYGMAYLVGLLLSIFYMKILVGKKQLWQKHYNLNSDLIDDMAFYTFIFGVFSGGRMGYVLFYNLEKYLESPMDIFKIWDGGMSIHGGIFFSALVVMIFARYKKVYYRHLFDVSMAALPIGILLGRIANFINDELWGHVTNVAWAVRFPNGGGVPRHPSQLYEGLLEGVVAFIILFIMVWHFKSLKRPGLTAGVFGLIYGASRIFVEFYRVPDPQIGYYLGFITQGMILSLPVLLLGTWLIITSKSAQKKVENYKPKPQADTLSEEV